MAQVGADEIPGLINLRRSASSAGKLPLPVPLRSAKGRSLSYKRRGHSEAAYARRFHPRRLPELRLEGQDAQSS